RGPDEIHRDLDGLELVAVVVELSLKGLPLGLSRRDVTEFGDGRLGLADARLDYVRACLKVPRLGVLAFLQVHLGVRIGGVGGQFWVGTLGAKDEDVSIRRGQPDSDSYLGADLATYLILYR